MGPIGFGLLHEVHDARERRSRRWPQRAYLDGPPDDARAAPDLVAGGAAHGQRLTGQRGLVQHPLAFDEATVDRHDLAGQHDQAIAGPHLPGRHIDEPARVAPVRHGRSAPRKRRQLAPRTPEGALFEQLAAREHQRHDESRREFTQRERAGNGKERDHVGAELTVQHPPHDGERERHDHGDQHDGPEHVGRVDSAGRAQNDARREGDQDGHGGENAAHACSVRSISRAHIGARPPERCVGTRNAVA